MLVDFVFYSLLIGAAFFAVVYFLAKKNKGIAWISTVVVALLVVVFVFPSAEHAKTLSDIAKNLALLASKAVYLLAWGSAAWLTSKALPD
ncbi:hypothetical protein [Pseudomonas chlororaphis]|uniref:Uncharacterized protein n=1 Tax=Pseudomonas chlororaphis subsp. aureofaciens TaxID=587851 RepID=A0AAD0ZJW5_9PSED|nr:hypothetical protein [Pseudomonas chlororaphis]AZE30145.1 hypothetical protein C4K07_3360 [Pseudomonas chlororaphis subsp. aureofaciens]